MSTGGDTDGSGDGDVLTLAHGDDGVGLVEVAAMSSRISTKYNRVKTALPITGILHVREAVA